VQQADGQIRADLTGGEIKGHRFRAKPPARVSSVSFDLIPSNNPIPREFEPFSTTNYDQTFAACYDLGEYLAITQADEGVFAAWGDNRNLWTSPSGSPAVGTHAQPDVFLRADGPIAGEGEGGALDSVRRREPRARAGQQIGGVPGDTNGATTCSSVTGLRRPQSPPR